MNSDDTTWVTDWTQGTPALMVSECRLCRHRWYFRRGFCPRCGSEDLRRFCSGGTGSVVAVSAVRRAPRTGPAGQVPFAIALVDLDEGIRVLGRCGLDVEIGNRVVALFPGDGEPRDVAAGPFFSPSPG